MDFKRYVKGNKLIKNIFGIGIYKILSIITSFLLTGLIVRYFSDDELNGIWLTVFSIISWLTLFDFGIGNGLRNNLTNAISNKNIELAKKYVTTTYVIMLVPVVIMMGLGFYFSIQIDWKHFLNVRSQQIDNRYLSFFILVTVVLYSFNFYLTIIHAVFHSTFKSYKNQMIQFYINICNVIFIYLLYTLTDTNNLIVLSIIYLGSSIFVLIIMTANFFKNNEFKISLHFKYFDKGLIKNILGLGMKFLVLQIAIIVLFNTDNLLISNYIGVSEVTGYQLVNKILSIFTMALSVVLTPFWTIMIELDAEKNYEKVSKILKNMILLILLLSLGVISTGFMSKYILKIWVGNTISPVENTLIIFMVVFTILHMWCNMFQAILNGLNLLNVQIITYGLATIINIPMSIFLVLNTNLGVSAIIIGTIISLFIPAIVLPIYTVTTLKKVKNYS